MRLLLLTFALTITGCTTLSTSNQVLNLKNVESLQVGHSTSTDVTNLLGTPSLKVVLNGNRRFEAWTYYENGPQPTPRLALHFDPQSGVLQSIAWTPNENERESELKSAKALYPLANFREYTPESTSPHVASDELINVDDKSGLEIISSIARGNVETIAWIAPEIRSLSSAKLRKRITVEKVIYDPNHIIE